MEHSQIDKKTRINPLFTPDNISFYHGSPSGLWVDEAIWGHRFRTNSSIGNFQFMEFMSVVESLYRVDPQSIFEPLPPNEYLFYKPRRNVLLRNLLFNNAALSRIEQKTLPNDELWTEWTEEFKESYEPSGLVTDLEYLKDTFKQFEKFTSHIRFLQRLTLDSEKSVRWTSKFIFPIGQEAMYTDLGKNMTRERINFMRNGELIYLMLSRSKRRSELRSAFVDLFRQSSDKNALLQKLLPQYLINNPDLSDATSQIDAPYLPYIDHPAYDRLADDILSLVQLSLPDQDVVEFLIPLFSFHIVLYQLETARACNGKSGLGSLVCEIVAPRSDQVRRASLASFNDNHSEGVLGVEAEIENFLQNKIFQEIENAEILSELDKAREVLTLLSKPVTPQSRFCWKGTEDENCDSTAVVREKFIERAKAEYRKKSGELHRGLGKECGLVSRRGTRSFRYAPTDDFLRMLVVTNVSERIELTEFLARLFRRYGLVINHQTAKNCQDLDPSHQSENAFRKNSDRLVRRLSSMGLARQMSDGCTYLENPLYEGKP